MGQETSTEGYGATPPQQIGQKTPRGMFGTQPIGKRYTRNEQVFIGLLVTGLVLFTIAIILSFLISAWAKSVAPHVTITGSNVDQNKRGTSLSYSTIIFSVFSLVLVYSYFGYTMAMAKKLKRQLGMTEGSYNTLLQGSQV